MNRFISIVLLGGGLAAAHGQGLVNFSNNDMQHGVNAPVYEADRVTPLAGAQFQAELFAGPSVQSLAPVITVGFLSQGYFSDNTQPISTVPARSTAWIQVDIWNTAAGASFGQAQLSGLPNAWWQSSIFSVVTGGGGVNPFPAAPLTGLGTSPVFLNGAIPEPSTLALCLVAGVMAALRFRRVRG